MRIGIDIDGVLTDLEQFLYDYGTKFNLENNIPMKICPGSYDEKVVFSWTEEQNLTFWNQYLEMYVKNYPVREFAVNILQQLKEEGNEIYIITARNEYGLPQEVSGKMHEFTKQWLEKNHITYDRIIYTEESKLKYCVGNYIDVMVEDWQKEIEEIETKIPVLCYSASYNAKVKGKNVTRVYSWYDILDKIHQLECRKKSEKAEI